MLNLLATTLCLLSGLGCRDEDLAGPPNVAPTDRAGSLVVSDSLCARVQFTITSATVVRTTFPNRPTCPSGLVLIRGPAAFWAQNRERRLQLFVRLLNTSGQTLQLPIRLYLPANGTVVLTPAGTPASTVVALNADSAERRGGRVWFVGGAGTLAANDSTSIDTLGFNVKDPVTQARFTFLASASTADTSRPIPPSGPVSLPHDSTLTVPSELGNETLHYRMFLGVAFSDTTSGATIRNLMQRYQATLIGSATSSALPELVLQFPDPGYSLANLQALRARLLAEPGVLAVYYWNYREAVGLDARFPVDGPTGMRAHWAPSSLTDATRSRAAIRAPLAWGCETGASAGTRPRLGVIDFVFDNAHPDLLSAGGSARAVVRVPDSTFPYPQLSNASFHSHGTGVAGIVSARGDNGRGVAGTIWDSELTLLAIGQGQSSVQSPSRAIVGLLDSARLSGVRVVVTATKIGQAGDTAIRERLRLAIERYVQAGNLFVISTGNRGLRITVDSLLRRRGGTVDSASALDQAAAMAYQSFPSRVLFVSGTDTTGAMWNESNHWITATQVTAPSTRIETLAYRGDFGLSETWTDDGTSFSAPFVAGVAGQLLSMDPTLTASDVKSYILRGAQAPRLNPTTGVLQPPNPVQGAPEVVYQLDAYGALSLLSSERAGTPICGYEVSAELGASGSSIRLEPPGRLPVDYPVPGSSGPTQLSVAQGGRRIALSYNTTGGIETAVLDHQGTVLQRLAGIQRVFLERDTADITFGDTTNPAVTLTGPGRGPADANLHPLAGFRFGENYTLVAVDVSPTGEHVGYIGVGFIDFACVPGGPATNFFDLRAEVVPIGGGSPTIVWRTSNIGCDGTFTFATGLGWNHSADAAAFTVNVENAMGFFSGRLLEWQRAGSTVRPAVIPGTTITGARYSADDKTLTLYRPDIGLTTCEEASHDLSTGGFGSVIGNPISVSPTLCTYGEGRTVQPNLRQISASPASLRTPQQTVIRARRLLVRTN